jgi:hypothetical protein
MKVIRLALQVSDFFKFSIQRTDRFCKRSAKVRGIFELTNLFLKIFFLIIILRKNTMKQDRKEFIGKI